jgi:hypothetical protein
MFKYEILKVDENLYNSIAVGSEYASGVCIDGIFDDERDQFLLIIRYDFEREK